MINQASEDKLHELLIEKLNARKRMIEPHDERFVIGFQTKVPGDDVDWQYLDEVIMRFVKDVIRTEKLKLLAEVRKRVALETELELLTYLLDERTERMFMQNPDTGEMTGNGWMCNESLSAVDASRIEIERRKRIAELKAQQEEV